MPTPNKSRHAWLGSLVSFGTLAIIIAACSQTQENSKPPSNTPILFVDADGSNPTMVRDTSRNPFPHLMYEDSSLSINDRCPVRKVGLNRRLQALFVNGKPIGFCWTPCQKVFVQDPEFFLGDTLMHIALNCMVDRDQPAIVDSAHRVSIGYETFFVSSQTAKRTFENDPLRYCGFLTDPVTKQLFRPSENSPRDTNNGRSWYFISDSTHMAFAMMPESYRDPAYRMLPKEDSTAH